MNTIKKGRTTKAVCVSLPKSALDEIDKKASREYNGKRSTALREIYEEWSQAQRDIPPYLFPLLDRYASHWQTNRAGALTRIFDEWEQLRASSPVVIAA